MCKGQKLLDDLETYTITIDRGISYGEKIIQPNAARDFVDKDSSDLVFVVTEIPHPFFKRDKHNLKVEVTLSLMEALLGFEKKIRTLDNRFLVFKREGVTQPNQEVVIPREGMPMYSQGSERGDLIIRCKVQMPTELTGEQQELFRTFFKNE